MIRGKLFMGCFLGVLAVYCFGLFARLMENDSAQFAVMAMRMYQENDWTNLIKGTEEYLDKPHMHYWLAALSFRVFGLYDWAYRIPALLLTLLAARSAYGLGKLFYNANAGRLAALIFMSAQTIVLSVIDVRTDAVLTGFAALGIWQLMRYLRNGSISGLLWGAVGAGLAFSTKGQIALLVIGLPLICQLIASGSWSRLANARLLLGVLVFGIAISPMLYAYYQQFDLHPEKVIRGRDHRSGILFIFWEQSFERLSGEGMGKNSSDYFFFFHTFLWVFLPWTLMGLAAFGNRAALAWKCWSRKADGPAEWATIGGIALIFFIISFAQFKLPHYLNILIPLFAILTGAYLDQRLRSGNFKWLRRAARLQAGIAAVVWLAVAAILCWVFPLNLAVALAILLGAAGLAVGLYGRLEDPLARLTAISIWACVFLNAVLNLHFYPQLLKYQAGSELAFELRAVATGTNAGPAKAMAGPSFQTGRPAGPGPIYKLTENHTWALDFYSGAPVIPISQSDLPRLGGNWIYAEEAEREALAEAGFEWDMELGASQFRISRLQGRFLNPATREALLGKRFLLHLKP